MMTRLKSENLEMYQTASRQPYLEFLEQLKASIRQHQYKALRAVNHELLVLYWEIGLAIHHKQQELGWGKSVVETLANDLQAEFPGRNGFSAQNLWLMRQFYREYSEQPKLQPLIREISWAKNLVILGRCKDPLEREFYLRATARFGWTKAVLQHQIDNRSYEKYLLNQTNFDQTLPEEIKAQAILAVKDHYTFDFLELAEEHGERDLEQALIANLRNFLAEMGGAFAFVGNQHRQNMQAELPSPKQIAERLSAWLTLISRSEGIPYPSPAGRGGTGVRETHKAQTIHHQRWPAPCALAANFDPDAS